MSSNAGSIIGDFKVLAVQSIDGSYTPKSYRATVQCQKCGHESQKHCTILYRSPKARASCPVCKENYRYYGKIWNKILSAKDPCDWANPEAMFLEMGPAPKGKNTLFRRDLGKPWSKENCYWGRTGNRQRVQSIGKKAAWLFGKPLTQSIMAKICGVTRQMIHIHLKNGYSPQTILEKYPNGLKWIEQHEPKQGTE